MAPRHTTIQEVNEDLYKSGISARGGRETQLRAMQIIPSLVNEGKAKGNFRKSKQLQYRVSVDPVEERAYIAKINLVVMQKRIMAEFNKQRLVKNYQDSEEN